MVNRLSKFVPVLVASLALCAACSQSPEKAVTVEGTGASASSDGPAAGAPAKPRGAGDQITQAQAEAALLTVAELPTGFAAQPSSSSSKTNSGGQISPPECQESFDTFKSQGSQASEAKASESFSQGGLMGVLLSQSIASYSQDNMGDSVKSIGQLLSKCPSFTSTVNSEMTKFTVSALSFPNLGDQTFAARMTGATQSITATLDVVIIGVGHNTVSFVAGGLQPMNPADLERVARDGVTKLGTVTK